MKKLITICAVVIWLTVVTQANATTIDFESLTDLEVVDNQFLALGADFTGSATVLSKSGSLNWTQFPPYSGDNVIYDWPTGTIRIDAVGPLWTMAGGYVTGTLGVTLTAYASDNSVLGTAYTGGANYVGSGTGLPPNMFLSVNAMGIAYVEFTDTEDTYTVDDFTFVPEPTTICLLGLGALGLLRKRRA